jgi:hypothetical protein
MPVANALTRSAVEERGEAVGGLSPHASVDVLVDGETVVAFACSSRPGRP